ncbi:MAG: YfiR family protein [Flavobacteriales bacterium]|nr:YfiR family protein [Flavobacteriales bacterium]
MRFETPFTSFSKRTKIPWNWLLLPLVALAVLAWVVGPMQQGDKLDNTDTQAIMKANFLFHFSASNEWPAETKAGPFRMAVVGNERLFDELIDKYAMKSIGAQPLEIVSFDTDSDMQAAGFFHLIYSESSGTELEKLALQWKSHPVLLVTDTESALERGSLINFVAVDRRLRYEINAKEASKKGVLIGSRILSWAVNSGK